MKWKKLEKFSTQGIYGAEFDRGLRYTNWRPHGSGDLLLLFTLEGEGRVGNALRQYPLPSGQLALFERGAEQVYFTDPSVKRWRFLWAHFCPPAHWESWMTWRMPLPGVRMTGCQSLPLQSTVEEAFRDMIWRVRQPGKLAVDLAFNSLERVLLLVSSEPLAGSAVDPRVSKALGILSHEIGSPFSVEDLARRCGLSPSRLSHLFKSSTGQTPQRFAEERKMLHAGQLLRFSHLSVQEAGQACGYDDPYYFSNRFRRWWGVSPRAYREAKSASLPPRMMLSTSHIPKRPRA